MISIGVAFLAAMGWTVGGRARSSLVGGRTAADPPAPRAQHDLATPAPQPLPAIAVSPLILTYHEISPAAHGTYNVSPSRFAQDMSSLHAAGWTTIGTARYLDWLRGGPDLPPRTMLLTFDDGTSGAWLYADRVLRRFGYRAVAFVVTGFVGRGDYYMTWPELHELARSGRWDIEAHGDQGHSHVPTDAQHTMAPFLINRQWGPDGLESITTFQRRIRADLERNVRVLVTRGFKRPRLFAYPFAAAETSTNDVEAPRYTQSQVQRIFEAAMTENVLVMPIPRPALLAVPRLGITSDMELPALLGRQFPRS